MSTKKIIKEAMEKNPVGLKEALSEELKSRISAVLEAKKMNKESDCEDDDENEEEEDDDELDEESNPKWKVTIGKKSYVVSARNTAEANKKAMATAKKEGNQGLSKDIERMNEDLDEARMNRKEAMKQDKKVGTYAELDDDDNNWHVFGANSGFSYGHYTSKAEAEKMSASMNKTMK